MLMKTRRLNFPVVRMMLDVFNCMFLILVEVFYGMYPLVIIFDDPPTP
jgi:hypothetical protein